jgi:hypothetical protein
VKLTTRLHGVVFNLLSSGMTLAYSRKCCARECNAVGCLMIRSRGDGNGVSGFLKGARYYNHLPKKDSAP